MSGITRYYMGGSSAAGFVGGFEPKDCYLYIIKGGAGSGKSTFMKRLCETLGGERELYYCSSDPDSLDGVIFTERKIAVADGTAPHIMELSRAGYGGALIDLGQCWDKGQLRSHAPAIEYAEAVYRDYRERIGRLISAAFPLFGDIAAVGREALLTEKLTAFCERTAAKLIPKAEKREPTAPEYRQLSALTEDGYRTFTPEGEVVLINDSCFCGGDFLIRTLSDMLCRRGERVILSRNLLSGLYEHIILPERGISFITPHGDFAAEREINFARFYDRRSLQSNKARRSFAARRTEELTQEASRLMGEAKGIHDEIEKFYIAAMDFDKWERIFTEILSDIIV